MKTPLAFCALLISAALAAVVVTCTLPASPESYEGAITLSIPAGSLIQDTVGKAISFSVTHTFTNRLDSIQVIITDSATAERTIIQFTQFSGSETDVERTFSSSGKKTVEVIAYYQNGTVEKAQFALKIVEPPADTQGPDLVVSTPEDGAGLTSQNVTVSGTARDASGISALTVKGAAASVDPASGAWSTTAIVRVGSDTIVVIATDNSPAKNQSTRRIATECDTTSPGTVPPIPAGVVSTALSSDSVRITWRTSAGASIYLVFRSATDTGIFVQIGAGADTVFLDTGLAASTTYYYQIAASNTAGSSVKSGTVSATTKAPPVMAPPTPAGLSAAAQSSSSIQLTWRSSTDASTYVVFRSATDSGIFVQIGTGADTVFVDTGLSASTTYHYQVAASNTTGSSTKSATASATTQALPLNPPATPTGLSATAQSAYSIRLTWTASTSASSYTIYRSASATGTFDSIDAVVGTSHLNSGLTANTTYYYKVTASNSAGKSAQTAPISATTTVAAPPAPATVTATTQSTSSIAVAWSKVTGATSYVVFRTTAGGAYDSIATATDTSYANSGLQPNTTYYYKVSTKNAGGSSAQSSAIGSATTLPLAPSAPDSVKALTLSSTSIQVSWNTVAGAASYVVYRGDGVLGQFDSVGTTTSPLLTLGSLTPSTTYFFKVTAVNAGGASPLSAVCSAKTLDPPVQAPGVPTGFGATALSSSSIRLSWTASTGASIYGIYRSASATGTFDSVGVTAATTYDDSGLATDTTYYYEITASNSAGTSAKTPAVSAKTLIASPPAPAGVVATGTSSTSIRIVWNRTASADSFKVHRGTSATGTFTQVGATVDTFFTNTGLTANSVYYYKVLASNAGGASALSAADSGTTWPAVPGVPGSLSASAVDSTRIALSWTASTGTASSYVISRSRDTLTFDSLTSVTATSYTAADLNPGTKYFFRVKAVNISGSSSDATASATTSPRTYTLTLTKTTGGEITAPAASTVTVNHGTPTTITAAPNTGYNFSGWTVTAGTATIANSNAITTTVTLISGGATVRAGFTQITYTVTFNTQGGSAVPSQTVPHGDTVVIPTAPTRTGYTFGGWYKESGGINSWTFATDVVTGATTLYAKWTAIQSTVSYHGNGNTSGTVPSSSAYSYGATVTVQGNTGNLLRTGYSFIGWNTAENGSGTDYLAGATFTMGTGGVQLYARWSINQYQVAYDGNGNSGGQPPASSSYNYGATATVAANSGSLTKTGYTFAGWNTAGNGSGTNYAAGATFTMGAADVVLYAKWTINNYTVSFDAQGGSAVSSQTIPHGGYAVSPTSPTRTNYTFAGWFKESGGVNPWSFSLEPVTGNVTLFAKWAMNAPTISAHPANATVYAGQTVSFGVTATGASLQYQWQKNTTDISGATSATYSISAVNDGDNGSTYRCVVSNGGGNATSNAATLMVNPRGMRLLSAGQFSRVVTQSPYTTSIVTIGSFWIDTTEVTQQSFDSMMGFNPSTQVINGTYPVNNVTWFDAALYCNARSKANGLDTFYTYNSKVMSGVHCTELMGLQMNYGVRAFRLPSEAQWEYACRAGTVTTYWWGNDTVGMGARAWSYANGGGFGQVATKIPNAWGLYDMAGNVMERCNDWYAAYSSGPQTDPEGPSTGDAKVSRGGSAIATGDEFFVPFMYSQSASRYMDFQYDDPTWAQYHGLRCSLAR